MSKFNRLFLKMRLTYLNMYLEILTVPIFRDYFKLDKMKFFFLQFSIIIIIAVIIL